MRRQIHAAALLAAAALAGCGGDEGGEAAAEADGGGGAEAAGSAETLRGTVGPGFTISVDGADGVAAGTYRLVVDDRSEDHNFHLTGPGGVDVRTGVDEVGEESFEVTLEAGEYTFVCDPHAESMNGSFTVG